MKSRTITSRVSLACAAADALLPRRRALRGRPGRPRTEGELQLRHLVRVAAVERCARVECRIIRPNRHEPGDEKGREHPSRWQKTTAHDSKPTPGLEPGTPSLR